MIKPSKNRERFEVYGRRDGRKVYVGTYDSKREALAAERRFLVTQDQIAAGELPPDLDLKRSLRNAAEEWLKSLAARSSRSLDGYTDRMNLYILPELGEVSIARLSKSQIKAWRDRLATRFAPATVNGILVCLSSALTDFVERGWMEANPCHGVEHIERPDRVYTWIETREEMSRLLAHCIGDIMDIVALALGTGMRLDELLHLQWADVDIERRLIAVHRGRQGTVKSGRARRVPILDAVLALLRQRALKRGGGELVFPGAVSKLSGKPRVRSKPGVQAAFKRAAKQAGFDIALRFHDLRHTFASHWVLDGGDIFRLSKVLGHSSVVITQKTYAHLAPEMWQQDYHRVSFRVPTEAAVYQFTRNELGNRITDRKLVVRDSDATAVRAAK